MYKSGRFITQSSARPHQEAPCVSYQGGRFINGRWSMDGCVIPWLTPEEMRGALMGRHLLIQGESMLRNLLHAFIFHIRGIEDIIETTYHDDAGYVFNETHNLFLLRSLTPEDLKGWNPKPMAASPSDSITFGLFFHLDISLSRGRIFDDCNGPSCIPRPDLRLAGPGYWAAEGLSDPRELAMLKEMDDYYRPKDVLLYSYPWLSRVKGNEGYAEVHALRQALIEKNLHLPGAEMANASVFGKLEDEMHYGCRFRKGKFFTPKDGDCRDMFNRNNAMIALHRLSTIKQR